MDFGALGVANVFLKVRVTHAFGAILRLQFLILLDLFVVKVKCLAL